MLPRVFGEADGEDAVTAITKLEEEPKKTLNRDGFAKEMQEVWRSRFRLDDEESGVHW